MGNSLSCLSKHRCLSTFKTISPLFRPRCNQAFRNTQGNLCSPDKPKRLQRRGYLLEGLSVPVGHQGPRFYQDVQCVFLNPVKQLLKSRHQSVIHLLSQLLIYTDAPLSRAENIRGVKELEEKGEES